MQTRNKNATDLEGFSYSLNSNRDSNERDNY